MQMTKAARATLGMLVILPQFAVAQDKADVAVERYTCRDLLRESGSDRDIAVAFLHGYLLGKSGTTAFNVDVLRGQTTVFIERCLDNPQANALTTMSSTASTPRAK